MVSFQVDPALNGYSTTRLQDFYQRLVASIRATPGVKSAGYAMVPVLAGDEWDSTHGRWRATKSKDGEDMQAFMNGVSTDYWKTMGVTLVEGRDFTDRDAGKDITVAIVNRKFARHFFGDKSAIGKRIGFGDGKGQPKLKIEIVGVTEDTLYEGPREGTRRQVFVPLLQSEYPDRRGVLRSHRSEFGEHVQHAAQQGPRIGRGHAGVRDEDTGTAIG